MEGGMTYAPYLDRRQAGRVLADALLSYADRDDVLVLGLPRGGVPVAYEVAEALHAPLDLMIVRKLGVPGHEELAMGAIASGGAHVLNPEVVARLGISEAQIEGVELRERRELVRREFAYRGDRADLDVEGRVVILVDDGLATGATMRAAAQGLREQRAPSRIVVAVPVAPLETVEEMRHEVDEVICPATPDPFMGVGQWYRDFRQTRDEEVGELLHAAWDREAAQARR